MTEAVLVHKKDGIATVTLNRPERRNAMNAVMCEKLRIAFDQIESDADVRVSIITGAGGSFCAGMDLKAFTKGEAEPILFGKNGFGGFVKRQRTKPVIAAVDGAALAGGFELMLAADLVVASQNAIFGLPEAKIGLFAGAGGALRLAQRISRVKANEILLTGKPFDADTALELGLLNAVVPKAELMQCAANLAASIVQNAPKSVELSLKLSDRAFQDAEDWEANDQSLGQIAASPDASEGISAFLEKRSPNWRN